MAAGFYDCEFIDSPPDSLQTECPVCLSVLRDPYRVDCCGYRFCRGCIEHVVEEDVPCPCCKSEEFDTFEDRRLRRSLNALRVRCSNNKRGCKWEGELGNLGEHLNCDLLPSAQRVSEERLKGCPYFDLKCLYCSNLVQRSKIVEHQKTSCPLRPTICTYCDKYCSSNVDVTTNHWSLCAYYPVSCSNECGKIMQRQDLAIHIATQCPLAEVDCDFREVGCKTKLLRKDMSVHLDESVASHLSLMSSSHSKALMGISEHDNLLKNLIHSTERLQRKKVKLSQALDTVNQNSAKLQCELSKRDEQITQHVKALQQQLVEETKKTRRDNAKLTKMVKQHLAEEKKLEREKALKKLPIPAIVVITIISITLLYAAIQPMVRNGRTSYCKEQPQFTVFPVPINLSVHNLSHHNIKWYILPSTESGAEQYYKMCVSAESSTNESASQESNLPICFRMIPEQCDDSTCTEWSSHGVFLVESANFGQLCTNHGLEVLQNKQSTPPGVPKEDIH